MSQRLRQLRKQRALKRRIDMALKKHRLQQWQLMLIGWASWFLWQWRGYRPEDAHGNEIEFVRDIRSNEPNLVAIALVKWAQSGRPLRWLPTYVRLELAA